MNNMGMNYRHFGNTFSKNTELLVKGCIYLNCMDYAQAVDELDPTLIDKYINEGYDRYLMGDTIDPFTIGDAIWQAWYDYFEWDGEPDDNEVDIFDVNENLNEYIRLRAEWG